MLKNFYLRGVCYVDDVLLSSYATDTDSTIPPEIIKLSKKTWQMGCKLIRLSKQFEKCEERGFETLDIRHFEELPEKIQLKYIKYDNIGAPSIPLHYITANEANVEAEKKKLLTTIVSETRRVKTQFHKAQLHILSFFQDNPELMKISNIWRWDISYIFPEEPFIIINGDCIDVKVLDYYDKKVEEAVIDRYGRDMGKLVNDYL
jgi:hypothetical protein